MQPSRAGFAYSFIYACEESQQNRVREVGPARQMAVARAAIGVGRVWQARERTFEVKEKDAVPFRLCVSSPAPGPLSLSMAKALLLSTSGS